MTGRGQLHASGVLRRGDGTSVTPRRAGTGARPESVDACAWKGHRVMVSETVPASGRSRTAAVRRARAGLTRWRAAASVVARPGALFVGGHGAAALRGAGCGAERAVWVVALLEVSEAVWALGS